MEGRPIADLEAMPLHNLHVLNEGREVEIERDRAELDRTRAESQIDLAMQRYRAAREIFIDLYGADLLRSDEGRRLFSDFLAGTAPLDDLDARCHRMWSWPYTTSRPKPLSTGGVLASFACR